MFLLYFLFSISYSVSKYVCFDDEKDDMCDNFNNQSSVKYKKYSLNDLKYLFDDELTSLHIVTFIPLSPIAIPSNFMFGDLSIISDNKKIELCTENQYLLLKNLDIKDSTIIIKTNQKGTSILNITQNFKRSNSHFLPYDSNGKLKLVMPKCESFELLRDFQEFEINLFPSKTIDSFYFPSFTSDCFFNLSITITSNINSLTDNFSVFLTSETKIKTLKISSNNYIFKNEKDTNFISVETNLPLTYIHKSESLVTISIQNEYCEKFYSKSSLEKVFSQNSLNLIFYSGTAHFHSKCQLSERFPRSEKVSPNIKCFFYNDSSIEIDSEAYLPISIVSSNDLKMTLQSYQSTITGYLFSKSGNISIAGSEKSDVKSAYSFSCLSFLNFSETNFGSLNKYLLSVSDLTEAEFFESVKHSELNCFLKLGENVVFSPKFLINAKSIICGTTVATLLNKENSAIDFKPKTNLVLTDNGTIVIPFHLNLNETYEDVMKIHHARYNELVEKGENLTFNFDNFAKSFKYYYLKYMCVFPNFSEVFKRTYNHFYQPKMINDKSTISSSSNISIISSHNYNLNHFVRLFIQRDDSPINSFYNTQFKPLICNISLVNSFEKNNENLEFEFSNSFVSEFARISEFGLNGEIAYNSTSSCIEYRIINPPLSSSELFVYLVNNDLIDSFKYIPFVSVITPMNSKNLYTMMRNPQSKNVIIIVSENMNEIIDFSKFPKDANIFICGISVQNMNDFIDFFNTIRKGKNLKNDLKKALEKISPKIPAILPKVKIRIMSSQSLSAIGVTIEKSIIDCGSINLALCSFKGPLFIGATNLITDLYSIQNLMDITSNYRFIKVELVPNFIGNNGGTTDLLSVTKIEFDENGWFFYSKGTIYDNACQSSSSLEKPLLLSTSSYNFGLPYTISESEFSIYSITDQVEFSLVQSKVPPKAIHFISGEKSSKKYMKERISLLSDEDREDDLIEIPETTTLSFTGKWEAIQNYVGDFLIEFGNSNAIINRVPQTLNNIKFSGNKNITIDCNNRNQIIKKLTGSGPISIKAIDGDVSIDSLSFKNFDKSFLDMNRQSQFSQISNIECEKHSKAYLDNVKSHQITLNQGSYLEILNLNLEDESVIKFNFNYDYEMPLLIINSIFNDISKLKKIVLNFTRKHHSPYKSPFESNLNKSKTFLKIANSKCSMFNDLFSFESEFYDFNNKNIFALQCEEIQSNVEFSLKLLVNPSLKLSHLVNDPDHVKADPISPPYLYIPSPSPTKKQNDMTAAVIGGTVGGVAFVGIVSFVIYFIVTGKKEDEALLNSMERKSAREEGVEMEDGIGDQNDRNKDESIENNNVGDINGKNKSFKDEYIEKI